MADAPEEADDAKPDEGPAYKDGTPIPEEEMRDGAYDPATLRNLEAVAVQKDELQELLKQLAQTPRRIKSHRPSEMTRGDIHPPEWARLHGLYQRLQHLINMQAKFSALAYSLFCLLDRLAIHAYVNTDDCLNGIMPAYGYGPDTVKSFDTAVGIVWSMAGKGEAQITPDMHKAIRELIQELGLEENDFLPPGGTT